MATFVMAAEQVNSTGGLNGWFISHPWISFFVIFIGISYVYNKVFRTRRLPILKSLIVYLLLALGSFMLLIFQIDVGLPIVLSILVAILLMVIVRVRMWWTRWRNKGE